MDEFDAQVAHARLEAERAQKAEAAGKALADEAAAQTRAVNNQACRSLEVAWRRVHEAIVVRRPQHDAVFVSQAARAEFDAALAAQGARRSFPLVGRRLSGLNAPEAEAIRHRNRVSAWELSDQLGLRSLDREAPAGTYFHRAFLATDGYVYCVDGYAHCSPDVVSQYEVCFGPGEDLAGNARVQAEWVLDNYERIRAGLASLVVQYDLKI
jgi:hypothetical protein